MPAVKIRREELEIMKAAAHRVERRSKLRFVMDESQVHVTDDEDLPGESSDESKSEDGNPPLICG